MASIRVVRTAKEDSYTGGRHRHVATLCLEDSRWAPKATAIANIKSGRHTYWTDGGGERANVVVVPRCSSCAAEYLRTDRDTTTKDSLLELPDC